MEQQTTPVTRNKKEKGKDDKISSIQKFSLSRKVDTSFGSKLSEQQFLKLETAVTKDIVNTNNSDNEIECQTMQLLITGVGNKLKTYESMNGKEMTNEVEMINQVTPSNSTMAAKQPLINMFCSELANSRDSLFYQVQNDIEAGTLQDNQQKRESSSSEQM